MTCRIQLSRVLLPLESVALGLATLFLPGCHSTASAPESPDRTVEHARLLLERRQEQKATRLIRYGRGLDPRDPAVADALRGLIEEARTVVRDTTHARRSDRARILLCAARDRLEPATILAEALEPPKVEDPTRDEAPPITPPEPLYTPNPRYTDVARRQRHQSAVATRLVIDEEGCVVRVEPLADDDHELDKTYGLVDRTVETLSTWVYRPALFDGEPIAIYWNTVTTFRLQ